MFSTDNGNSYYAVPVFFLTWIIFLSPLFLYLIIKKLNRKKENDFISPESVGIIITRKKSLQSSLIGIPIYINDIKAGVIDNGQTKFFNTTSGIIEIQAGNGNKASEKIQVEVVEGNQLSFELEIEEVGFNIKYVLKNIIKTNANVQN